VITDPLNKMAYAITAEPAVLDLDSDGFADLVYIGDVGGQMWKWDISPIGTLTSGKVPTSVWPVGLLFQAPVATVAAGALHYHSIFQGAAAAYLKGVLSLSFGSGERADLGYIGTAAADPNDLVGLYDDNNRFWVVLDRTPLGPGNFPTTLPIYEAATAGHQNLTDVTYLTSDPDPTDAGYFFRVPDGQKFITDHIVFNGQVFSLTYMPDPAGAGVSGNCALGGTTIQWAWSLSSGVGVLDNPADPASTVRNAMLANGAPTNPRITVAKGPDGKPRVKITVQTSTGQQPDPPNQPKAPNPVEPIFWRQTF
jgi:type IV pilus assembly protein PilY1